MKHIYLGAILLAGWCCTAAAATETPEQAQRWHDLAVMLFGKRVVGDGTTALTLHAPDRAMDASLVPLKIDLSGTPHIKTLSIVVDNNPSPLVGTFHLGPAFAQQELRVRVRVNDFTFVHAVAETDDGKLLAVSRYVQAAGGCSSPSTGESAEIAARIGRMQLHRTRSDSDAVPAQLLISHPNYNGMQLNTHTQGYTPARYLTTVSLRVGGVSAFDLDSGISLSEDPVIGFAYLPKGDGAVEIVAKDSSGAVFTQRFEALQ